MKVLFSLGHPAHFHLFRFVLKELKEKSCRLIIVIKSKDVLKNLLDRESLKYLNILPEGKTKSSVGFIYSIWE